MDLMELKEAIIRDQYDSVYKLLSECQYKPKNIKVEEVATESSTSYTTRGRLSTVPGLMYGGSSSANAVKFIETINNVKADPILTEIEAHVIRVMRRGISVGYAAGEEYKASNQDFLSLLEQNKQGVLTGEQAKTFADYRLAYALVRSVTFVNYVNYILQDYCNEYDDIAKTLFDHTKEVTLTNELVEGLLFEVNYLIKQNAKDDHQLISIVKHYFRTAREEMNKFITSARFTDAWVKKSFKVEKDGFIINGFESTAKKKSQALTMTFKKPEEIIGNHIAKHQAQRLAKTLMAYDFDKKKNPFVELGGFSFTFLGDGNPGTGKTTLIQMMAGLLNDYCNTAGYTFRYKNLGIEAIDSYQGNSGKSARQFIEEVLDPSVIGFGTIDDIDQVAGKRNDRNGSAGAQEITAVLMDAFAGANTVVRGNCTFGMFSNYPENVDDALRQRAGARFLIDGPITQDDYIDILALLVGKNNVERIGVGNHDLYSTQGIKVAIKNAFEKYNTPQEPELLEVFNSVSSKIGKMDNLQKIGVYLKAIQEREPRFTGRAIKNITDSVKFRAMDFDLPDEWMENPEMFMRKDYTTKLNMIKELMIPVTPDMIIQEVNRYADSEFRYSNKSDQVAIDNMVRDAKLRMKASDILKNNANEE